MKLQIRTKDNLVELLKKGISHAWRVNKGRLNSITEVEIYDFSGKAKISGTFDRENSQILENGRVAVAFKDAKIEQADYKWVGQNPIKYQSATNEDVELMEDEVDATDQEEWNIDYVNDRRILVTGCEGVSGVHVGFRTNPFIPVANYETIISYLNDLFFDDDAENLFTYEREGDAIVLDACTYLLSIGDAFEKYMEDYSEEELTALMNENGLHAYLQSYILGVRMESIRPTVDELVQQLLMAPNQTIEVECIDTEYGNTSFEIHT